MKPCFEAPAEGGMALIDVRPMGMEPEPTEPEARISVKEDEPSPFAKARFAAV
jgi:hypothetical protein